MTDLNKEREAFLNTFQYYKGRRDIIFSHEHELFMTRSNNPSEIAQKEISNMNSRWDAWLRCAKHRDAELEKAKAQAVPDTKPIAYKVSFDSWQRQHGKDYFEFWKPDEFEGYKPDYLIPLYSFPTISSDFVVVPKEPTQKMLNAAHCYMNPVKGSDVHPETNRKRKEMYKAMIKASESGAEG